MESLKDGHYWNIIADGDYAYNVLGIHKIHGDNDSDNPASGRVMEKAGFTNEAVFKEHVFKGGRCIDIVHWVRFNERDM